MSIFDKYDLANERTVIEELIEAVFVKEGNIRRMNRGSPVKLCIYITPDHLSKCTYEIRNAAVGATVMEFVQNRTILGHQVCRVVEEGHPPYRIVNLNG